MSQNTYIFQLFSPPTEMYKNVTHVFGSICRCVCNRRAERTNSCPVSRKQCTKLYWESLVFSIYMKTSAEAIFRRGKLNLGWSLYVFFWSLGSPFRGLTVKPPFFFFFFKTVNRRPDIVGDHTHVACLLLPFVIFLHCSSSTSR